MENNLYLIDSSGWIEFLCDEPNAIQYKSYTKRPDLIITPSIVCFEVYRVIKRKVNEEHALKAIATLHETEYIPLDESLTVSAADVSLSYGLAMADAIIYCTAKQYNAKIITSDQDFKDLEGVIYIEKQ